MSYRNGVYVAFDGNGEKDPSQSDQKYFQLLKAWDENDDIKFEFSNSHDKTYQVKDNSSKETLINRLKIRMSNSKSFLIIISKDTNYDRGLLNDEIEWAVEIYNLPIMVAYVGYKNILYPEKHMNEWPKKLKQYIENGKAKCIHIPFKKDPIMCAIKHYKVDEFYPKSPYGYYSKESYLKWGLL